MSDPELILLVKFKSPLTLDEVTNVIDSRIEDFRALEGLQQKYYLQDKATGEYGGLYIWASQEDFLAYRESELRTTIGKAYQTEGEPQIQVLSVIKALRD